MDCIFYNIIGLVLNFLRIAVLYENVLVLRRYMLMYLDVACHDVCNLQMVQLKKICV